MQRNAVWFALVLSSLGLLLPGCPEPSGYLGDLQVNPLMLDFGAELNELTFQVWNGEQRTLDFNISVDEPWITCTPTSGASDGPNDPQTVTVTIDRSIIEKTTYQRTIRVYHEDEAGRTSKNVTVSVRHTPVGPTAAFFAVSRSGAEPLTIQFTDDSDPGTAPITQWEWDFGDGTNGPETTAQHPEHVYETPGTYTVSLTVTTNVGADTETKTDYIVVFEAGAEGKPTSAQLADTWEVAEALWAELESAEPSDILLENALATAEATFLERADVVQVSRLYDGTTLAVLFANAAEVEIQTGLNDPEDFEAVVAKQASLGLAPRYALGVETTPSPSKAVDNLAPKELIGNGQAVFLFPAAYLPPHGGRPNPRYPLDIADEALELALPEDMTIETYRGEEVTIALLDVVLSDPPKLLVLLTNGTPTALALREDWDEADFAPGGPYEAFADVVQQTFCHPDYDTFQYAVTPAFFENYREQLAAAETILCVGAGNTMQPSLLADALLVKDDEPTQPTVFGFDRNALKSYAVQITQSLITQLGQGRTCSEALLALQATDYLQQEQIWKWHPAEKALPWPSADYDNTIEMLLLEPGDSAAAITTPLPVIDTALVGKWHITAVGVAEEDWYMRQVLYENGAFLLFEFVSGNLVGFGEGTWTFDRDTGWFEENFPNAGAMAGVIDGTYDDFLVAGKWANGVAATFHWERLE